MKKRTILISFLSAFILASTASAVLFTGSPSPTLKSKFETVDGVHNTPTNAFLKDTLEINFAPASGETITAHNNSTNTIESYSGSFSFDGYDGIKSGVFTANYYSAIDDFFALDDLQINTSDSVFLPEPFTMLFMGTGVFGLIAISRRKIK